MDSTVETQSINSVCEKGSEETVKFRVRDIAKLYNLVDRMQKLDGDIRYLKKSIATLEINEGLACMIKKREDLEKELDEEIECSQILTSHDKLGFKKSFFNGPNAACCMCGASCEKRSGGKG